MLYSVIVPVFNEAECLLAFHARISKVLDSLDGPGEVVFIDDGSTDNSLPMLRELHLRDPRMKVVSFSRNFGQQIAISAGIDYSSGLAIVIIDADLQDPPELIPALIAKWKEGYEVVYAVRQERRGESVFKRATAALFYRLIRRMTNVSVPVDAGDFRLLGDRAVRTLRGMREKHRYIRGLVSWVGFKQTGVPYVRDERRAGETKYPLHKMIRFALDGITSFSTVPLRLATYAGFLGAILSASYMGWVFYVRVIRHEAAIGWSSLMAAILFLGSAQLITLGILGEYIGRICDEVRDRPLYVVSERLLAEDDHVPGQAAHSGHSSQHFVQGR